VEYHFSLEELDHRGLELS